MNTEPLTFKRCLIAGIWTCITVVSTDSSGVGALATILISFTLAGLPWLVFVIADKKAEGAEPIGAGEAIATIFCGAFISILCAVPVTAVFVWIRKLL